MQLEHTSIFLICSLEKRSKVAASNTHQLLSAINFSQLPINHDTQLLIESYLLLVCLFI